MIQADLPDIACYAAAELDAFRLGTSTKHANLRQLVAILRRNFPKQKTIDDQTIDSIDLAFAHRVVEEMDGRQVKTVKQLIDAFHELIDALDRLASDTRCSGAGLQFCLKISKLASIRKRAHVHRG